MSNSYFQFKQFTIQQDKCAMKVTTDGCLFGSIAANESGTYGSAAKVLDIGTGTGLLSLMIAQQNLNTLIDAIEIDESATQQANENVAASPWADRIKIITGDILNYVAANLYDVIISNPPFYEQQWVSPNAGRQQAHHSSHLTLRQLFQRVKRLLRPNGKFFVMMPFYRTTEITEIANELNLYPEKHWLINQTPKHDFFRSIFCFSLQNETSHRSISICIKDDQNKYTTIFAELLNPYYLKL